jgi:hypothetical protein
MWDNPSKVKKAIYHGDPGYAEKVDRDFEYLLLSMILVFMTTCVAGLFSLLKK